MTSIATSGRVVDIFHFFKRKRKYRLLVLNQHGEECPMLISHICHVFSGVVEHTRRFKNAEHVLVEGDVYTIKWRKD
jgi:hypothetical protein